MNKVASLLRSMCAGTYKAFFFFFLTQLLSVLYADTVVCHDYACLQHRWFQLLVLTCLGHVRYLRSICHFPVQCEKDNSLEQAALFTCFTRDHYDNRLMSTWVLLFQLYNSCCLHYYKINPVSISSMSKMARLEKLLLTIMLGNLRPYLVIKTPLDV